MAELSKTTNIPAVTAGWNESITSKIWSKNEYYFTMIIQLFGINYDINSKTSSGNAENNTLIVELFTFV
jgi:hypothetical protein